MGGKSTVLRSVCSTAVLANCGMMVPCVQATVPRFDAFMLRAAESSDSPQVRAH
jgi:DNA mismatch repair ATPase MutS